MLLCKAVNAENLVNVGIVLLSQESHDLVINCKCEVCFTKSSTRESVIIKKSMDTKTMN